MRGHAQVLMQAHASFFSFMQLIQLILLMSHALMHGHVALSSRGSNS